LEIKYTIWQSWYQADLSRNAEIFGTENDFVKGNAFPKACLSLSGFLEHNAKKTRQIGRLQQAKYQGCQIFLGS
jgi:hypothetical protein